MMMYEYEPWWPLRAPRPEPAPEEVTPADLTPEEVVEWLDSPAGVKWHHDFFRPTFVRSGSVSLVQVLDLPATPPQGPSVGYRGAPWFDPCGGRWPR